MTLRLWETVGVPQRQEAVMATSMLETKFHLPRARPGAVLRPRLIELLDRGTAATLTLISAPTGFGKTTLLAQWLERRALGTPGGPSVAWLSLDAGDNDARSFGSYLVSALRTVAPDAGTDELAQLHAADPPPITRLLTTLLNDIGGLTSDLALVLDDYHVIESREVHDAVAYLLDHAPPRMHLVITSRTDPPVPLARLRARGELVEIRVADLRFSPDEAASFFNGAM
ncbi:MAG: helix-turn-helix transcriptional regulator, partial [Nakamurella sp.]